MTHLTSFSSPANVAVIGASGGIGAALCRSLEQDSRVGTVHALSRAPASLPQSDKFRAHTLDLAEPHTIERAAAACADEVPVDLVIVATGILHGGSLQPEKAMRELDPSHMADVLAVNTVGPAMVARHFLPRLNRKGKSALAVLSARVGSIGDNRLGGWVSYRASKAALNMVVRTLSIEHRRRWPDSVVVALHPGTVDTSLSRPFSSRVPDEKLFTPDHAAERLLAVIDGLSAEQSGGFFAWDGTEIPY